jgi:hypothetical protein
MDITGTVICVAVVGLVLYVFGSDLRARLKGGHAAQIGEAVAQRVTSALAAPATRTAGNVVDSILEDVDWLKENTDLTDAAIQPVEALLPHLLHRKVKGAA